MADDSWLIQKHRDIVQDFCDVGATEKEYIKEWDAFIQRKRIVSEAFIGRAVVEFVNEKVSWLLESESRTREFGKHLTVLIARGLEEDCIKLVQARLQEQRAAQEARAQKAPAPEKAAAPEPSKERQRNSNGCAVCAKPVRGSGLLVCSSEVSALSAWCREVHDVADILVSARTARSHSIMKTAYERLHGCQLSIHVGDAMTACSSRAGRETRATRKPLKGPVSCRVAEFPMVIRSI